MKKLFSLLALLMAVFLTPPKAAGYTVYFDKPATDWATPYAYCWQASDDANKNDNWPGEAMTRVGASSIWQYEVDSSYDKVIFSNNGSNQTSDLTATADHVYTTSGDTGKTIQTYVAENFYPSTAPFVVGEIVGQNWAESNTTYSLSADAEIDFTYSVKNVPLDGTGNFRLLATSGSWDGGYGSNTSNGQAITAGTQYTYAHPTNNNWAISAGTYDIYLNFLTQKMWVEVSSATPVPAFTFNPDGGSGLTADQSVTITQTNASYTGAWWYTVDGGAKVPVAAGTNSATFTVAAPAASGTKTVTAGYGDNPATKSADFVFAIAQTYTIYYVDTEGWANESTATTMNLGLYTWSDPITGTWGSPANYVVTKVDGYTNLYKFEITSTGTASKLRFYKVLDNGTKGADNVTFEDGKYYKGTEATVYSTAAAAGAIVDVPVPTFTISPNGGSGLTADQSVTITQTNASYNDAWWYTVDGAAKVPVAAKTSSATFDVTVPAASGTKTVTAGYDETQVAEASFSFDPVPTALYLFTGTGWNSVNATLTKDGNTFSVSDVSLTAGQYFAFTTNASPSSGSDINYRPADASATKVVTDAGLTADGLSSSGSHVWQAQYTGTYDISITFTNGSTGAITITPHIPTVGVTAVNLYHDASKSNPLTYNAVSNQWELNYAEVTVKDNNSTFQIEVVYEDGTKKYFTTSAGLTNANYWLNSAGNISLGLANGGKFVFGDAFEGKAVSVIVNSFGTGVYPVPANMTIAAVAKVPAATATLSVGGTAIGEATYWHTGTQLDVTAEVGSATAAFYTVDGGAATPISLSEGAGSATINLGTPETTGTHSYEVILTATNSVEVATVKTVTFNLIDLTAVPEWIKVRGSGNWDGVTMTKNGSVFTGTITLSGDSQIKFKDSNDVEWGASTSANVTATSGTAYDVFGGYGYVWKLPSAGTYSVTFDFSTKKATFELIRTLYLRNDAGSGWSWGSDAPQFVKTDGHDIYTYDITPYSDKIYFFVTNEKNTPGSDDKARWSHITGTAKLVYWKEGMLDIYDNKRITVGDTNTLYLWNEGVGKCMVADVTCGNTYRFTMDFENTTGEADLTITALPVNFKVREERATGSRTRNSVFVRGKLANAGNLRPDWEMTYIGEVDGEPTWQLDNVTLHGDNVYAQEISPADEVLNTSAKVDITSSTYGKVYNLTYKRTTGLTVTKVQDYPQFLSLVGYPFQQLNAENTPNLYSGYSKFNDTSGQGNTKYGWQESWVLYEDGYPLRDNDGHYIYSTQWPPMSPITFMETYTNSSSETLTREVSSVNMTFTRYAGGAKTGKELKTILSGSDYDNLFGTDKDKDASDGDTRLADATSYVRYTAKDVWVMGAMKIWTGWNSGNLGSSGADWNGFANWGKGKEDANDKGTQIASGLAWSMSSDAGNVIFEQPTFFKAIEFFVELDNSGNPTANAVFYTVRADYNVTIDAQPGKQYHSDTGNNIGQYKLTIDEGQLTSANAKIKSFKVERFYADDNMALDYSEWTKAYSQTRPEGHTDDNVVIHSEATGSGLTMVDTAVRTAFSNANWQNDDLLDNGRYVYLLTVVLSIQDTGETFVEKTIQVPSTVFTIANYDQYRPLTRPMQLLELEKAGQTALRNGDINLKEKVNLKYMTFVEARAGYYYVIDADGHAFEISATLAKSVIADNDNYKWTSKYFVTGFNGTQYAADMDAAKNAGLIDSYKAPTVTVALLYIQDTGESVAGDAKPTVRSDNGYYGAVFTETSGDLSQKYFRSKLSYTYTPAGQTATTKSPAAVEGTTKPQIARPYGGYYAYKYNGNQTKDMTDGGIKWLKLKATSPSKMQANADNDTFDPYDADNCNTVYVKASEVDPRTLDCVFYFSRPNLSAELLKNYDIRYTITVTSQSKDSEGVLTDHANIVDNKTYVDKDRAVNGSYSTQDSYKFTITKVNPHADVYPVLKITSTTYVRVDASGNPNTLVANFGPTVTKTVGGLQSTYDLYIAGQNHAKRDSEGMSLGSIYFRTLCPGYYDYMTGRSNPAGSGKYLLMYGGHKELVNSGDVIHDPTVDDLDRTDESLKMTPLFYQLEFKCGGETKAYPYLVKHTAGHAEGTVVQGILADSGDPLVGTYVAEFTTKPTDSTTKPTDSDTEPTDSDKVITYLNPVYIFYRDPAATGLDVDKEHTDLTPLDAQRSAPQRSATSGSDGNGNKVTVTKDMPDYDALPTVDSVKDLDTDDSYQVLTGAQLATTTSTGGSTTGIDTVAADYELYEEGIYYNLQGIRVDNPVPGIYLQRRGSSVEKVVIR